MPERVVSPKEEAEQKAALKTDWELVVVLDFLSLFQVPCHPYLPPLQPPTHLAGC